MSSFTQITVLSSLFTGALAFKVELSGCCCNTSIIILKLPTENCLIELPIGALSYPLSTRIVSRWAVNGHSGSKSSYPSLCRARSRQATRGQKRDVLIAQRSRTAEFAVQREFELSSRTAQQLAGGLFGREGQVSSNNSSSRKRNYSTTNPSGLFFSFSLLNNW